MSHPRPGAAALKSVCFALFAAATSMSCVFAILPSVGRGLGLSETQLGWVVAPAALVFVLFGPVWGRAGQHLGARAIFTSTLTLLALFTLLFGHTLAWRQQGLLSVSACFGLLLLSRLLLSPFSAAMLPTAQSFIAHSTEGTGRTRGLAAMGASFALGMVASPGLAAVAVGAGMLAPFYLVAVLLLLAAGLTWRNLPRESVVRAPHRRGQTAHARTAWSALWQPLSVLVLLYAVYGILMQVTGFRLQDQFHLDAQGATQWAGAALMATAAALVAAQMVLARAAVTDPQRQRRIAAAGAVAGLAGLLSLLFDSHLAFYLLAMAAFGLSLGVFMPFILSMLTTRAQAAGDQSRVGGLSGAAQGLGMVIGPLLGAASYRFNAHLPYALALVALALGSMLYGLSSRAPQRF